MDVPKDFANLIRSLYKENETVVRTYDVESANFHTERGITHHNCNERSVGRLE